MVPPGAVSVTACRYSGLNPPDGARRFRLIGVAVSDDAGMIATFTSELNAIRRLPRGRATSCPDDVGTTVQVTFGYRSGPGDTVRIGLSGCNAVSNGHLRRLALGAPVVSQVGGFPQALAGIPPWPRVPIAEPG